MDIHTQPIQFNINFQACMLDKICPAFWSNWTDWESCNKECGPGGRQKKVRHCQEFYTNLESDACNGPGVMYRQCKKNKRCSKNDNFVLIPYNKHGKGRLIDMTNPNSSLCLVPILKSNLKNLGFGLDLHNFLFFYMIKTSTNEMRIALSDQVSMSSHSWIKQHDIHTISLVTLDNSLVIVGTTKNQTQKIDENPGPSYTYILNTESQGRRGPDLPENFVLSCMLNLNMTHIILIANDFKTIVLDIQNNQLKKVIEDSQQGETFPNDIVVCGYDVKGKFVIAISKNQSTSSIMSYPFGEWNHNGPELSEKISAGKILPGLNDSGLFLIGINDSTSETYYAYLECRNCLWNILGTTKQMRNNSHFEISKAIKIPPKMYVNCTENPKPGYYGVDNLGAYV